MAYNIAVVYCTNLFLLLNLPHRLFVVIDDMRTEYWNTIKNAFPRHAGVSSKVIVTTAIHSIANACTSINGHVYLMRPLDEEHSRQLFFKEASFNSYEPTEQVVKKCDGLPPCSYHHCTALTK